MPQTITEKILARSGGLDRVSPGDNHPFRPDYMVAYDFPGYTDQMFKQMHDDFGITEVDDPERYLVFIDHMLSKGDEREEDVHRVTREWCAHSASPSTRAAASATRSPPNSGTRSRASSSSTSTATSAASAPSAHWAGASAAICWRPGSAARSTSTSRLRPLPPHRLVRRGRGQPRPHPRHHRRLGADGCAHQVMEFTGPGAEGMSLTGGRACAAWPCSPAPCPRSSIPTTSSLDHVRKIARTEFEPVRSDPDAVYTATHEIELTSFSHRWCSPDRRAPPTRSEWARRPEPRSRGRSSAPAPAGASRTSAPPPGC